MTTPHCAAMPESVLGSTPELQHAFVEPWQLRTLSGYISKIGATYYVGQTARDAHYRGSPSHLLYVHGLDSIGCVNALETPDPELACTVGITALAHINDESSTCFELAPGAETPVSRAPPKQWLHCRPQEVSNDRY